MSHTYADFDVTGFETLFLFDRFVWAVFISRGCGLGVRYARVVVKVEVGCTRLFLLFVQL